jgi:hypothetical protein
LLPEEENGIPNGEKTTHKILISLSPTAKERSPQKENSENLERSECKQTEGKGPQKHNQIFRKDCERERERERERISLFIFYTSKKEIYTRN